LDTDYLAFAILMGVFGVVGITATVNVSPNIFASPTCNCIPSPAARFQELSVILLAFSAVLAPVAVMRRTAGLPTSASPQAHFITDSGTVYTGTSMKSGGLMALGVSLVVFGVALIAIPAFLVLKNPILIGEGAATVALGLVLAYRGSRPL
jgi:hypothetical protein